MKEEIPQKLIEEILRNEDEGPCIEFKHNFHGAEELGKDLSALANAANISEKQYAYILFGIEDRTKKIVGTKFYPRKEKNGNEDIEQWLQKMLKPRINFNFYEKDVEGKHLVLVRVPAAVSEPVKFRNIAYIRIASNTTKLAEYSNLERQIWLTANKTSFEKRIALQNVSEADVTTLLDTQIYFDLMKIPFPSTRGAVIERFVSEKLLVKNDGGFSITNLGALLFAKDLSVFDELKGKSARLIIYDGKNKLNTSNDIIDKGGYVVGFQKIIDYINDRLPQNEVIERAFRQKQKVYPELIIRELTANAILHQDLDVVGRPTVEIYDDRIEFSNPGLPVLSTDRFIDEFQTRNEILADLLRRLGICEEKGSGFDKVIFQCELNQLPAPKISRNELHTKITIYAPQKFRDMSTDDKMRACYQHCCLKYVSNEKMTNQSLRERFKIEEKNSAMISRIIAASKEAGLIKKEDDENRSNKFAKYIPFWA